MRKLNTRTNKNTYQTKISAQSYLNPTKGLFTSSSCGSACGAGDDTEEKPEEEPKSSACGA